MRRIFLGVSIAALACSAALANSVPHPAAFDDFIAKHARKHGVPERLVHRILMRESRYDPKVFHNACYGLMQIKYRTAQSMGYRGAPQGLFDPYVNMTYAIPYLANAYHIAGGDEDRAVMLFAGGYYYAAKQRQMLAALRTADSAPLAPEKQPAPVDRPAAAAMPALFAFMQTPAPQQPSPAAPAAALAYASAGAAPTAPPPAQDAAAAEPAAEAPHPAKTHRAKAAPRATPLKLAAAEHSAPETAPAAAPAAVSEAAHAPRADAAQPQAADDATDSIEPAASTPQKAKAHHAKSARRSAEMKLAAAEKTARAAPPETAPAPSAEPPRADAAAGLALDPAR